MMISIMVDENVNVAVKLQVVEKKKQNFSEYNL